MPAADEQAHGVRSTSPTNPIDPETDTIAPVSSADAPSSPHRVALTLTPSDAADTSPNAKASSSLPVSMMGTPAMRMAPNEIATAGQRAPAREPSSQPRISR